MKEKILEVKNLTTVFDFDKRRLIAVNKVDLSVYKKEIIGIAGESGCGKSMTASSILRLVPFPGKIIEGEVIFKDMDLLKLSYKSIQKIRGKEISLIIQDPLSALNPSYTIYWHISEIIRSHKLNLDRKKKRETIVKALKNVGINDPELRMYDYPHQFSGGMRQRVVIAMAIMLKPSIVIADEPTTALDVTTQKEIFNLLESLKDDLGITFIVISHNLYLLAERCNRIYIMYSGEIIEEGSAKDIFNDPLHPYTKGLLSAIPKLGLNEEKLGAIKGEVQDLMNLPQGCFFQNRCKYIDKYCVENKQILRKFNNRRLVRCHKVEKLLREIE